jgi:hypothetical protein
MKDLVNLAVMVLVMAVMLPAFAHIFGRAASAWVLHQELALLRNMGRGLLWCVRNIIGGALQFAGFGVNAVGRRIRGLPPARGRGRRRGGHRGRH